MDIENPKETKKQKQNSQIDFHHLKINYPISPVKRIKYDFNKVLVGRENGLVESYRQQSYIRIKTYTFVNSPITGLQWLDNQHFIVSYLCGSVCVFNLHNPYPLSTLQLIQDIAIFDLTLLNDSYAVIACSQGILRLIEIDSLRKTHILFSTAGQQDQQCLSVDNKNDMVFAAYSNGSVKQFQFNSQALVLVTTINLQPSVTKSKIFIPWVVRVNSEYIWVGSESGSVQIYERKFFTEAAILTGLVTENLAYFAGTDSKVVCINARTLQVCGQLRGQSHDIFTLELIQQRLVSSGVNGDLCFYKNKQDGTFEEGLFRVQALPSKDELILEELNSQNKKKQEKNQFLIINHRNKLTFNILDQEVFNEISELQTSELIQTAAINPRCTYLAYSNHIRTTVLRLNWQVQSLESLQKISDFESATYLILTKGGILYYANKINQIYQVMLSNFQKKLILNFPGTVDYMQYIEPLNQIVVVSYEGNIMNSFNINKINEIQEINIALPEHQLFKATLITGQNNLMCFLYSNNRFATYIFSRNPETKLSEWKMTQHTKQFLYQLPKSFLQFKQQVKGAISDGIDEKRMIFFTNQHFIKVHQRGKPAKDCIQAISSDKQVEFQENFSFYQNQNQIIDIILTKQGNQKNFPVAIVLEWDKDESFKNMEQAYNAKKYKN